jgi:hypothetical protein
MRFPSREESVTAPPQGRCAFVLLRSLSDLDCLRQALADLRSIINGHASSSSLADKLLGIWVDAQGVANVPCALDFPARPLGERTVRIVEAMGINGIWMLCFLDAQSSQPSRVDLLDALLEASGYEDQHTTPGAFIPVFPPEAASGQVHQEMKDLQAPYPGLILPPLRPDLSPATGDRLSASPPRSRKVG